MMKPRLEILYNLLKSDGHIFVHIDYNELAHVKVMLDEVFGRNKYVSLISWQRVPEGRTVLGQGQSTITVSVEYILVYAKDNNLGKLNRITKWINATNKIISQYGLLVKSLGQAKLVETFQDSKGNTVKISQHKNFNIESLPQKTLKETPEIYIKFFISNFEKIAQSVGVQVESTFQQKLLSKMNEKNVLYSAEFISSKGKYAGESMCDYYINGRKLLFLKDYSRMERNSLFREVDMNNFWTHDEIPVTGTADEGGNEFKRSKKPEKLLQRIVELGSNLGDLVLDSFAGSGTTGAVAHKLGRRWIMIEMGKHAETKCKPRLTRVVSGEDQTGISKAVGWAGGGGFAYCELGEPLIINDAELGIKRINPAYNNGDLIRAVCRLEGFGLIGNGKTNLHGKHGMTYAHVTEFFVNQEYVNHLAKEIDDDEKLRIYCYSHTSKLNLPKNVDLRRMPGGLSNQDSG
jgi:adenine-specific DNA-methyltransferase